MSSGSGWVPAYGAQFAGQTVPSVAAPVPSIIAAPVLPAEASALTAGAASPWPAIVQALPPAQARDFYGLDLTQPNNLELFTRVLDRTALKPEQLSAKTAPEDIAQRLHNAVLAHSMGLLERLQSFTQENAGKPLSERARTSLGRQIDDLIRLNALFPDNVQKDLQEAAGFLHSAALPKPEDLASLKQLSEQQKQAAAGDDGKAATQARETSAAIRRRNGLRKKEASDAMTVLDALEKLPKNQWTDERKARIRELFLNTEDESLRRHLAHFFQKGGVGIRFDSQLIDWLYPEAKEEFDEFYPSLQGRGDFFMGSIFADPPLFRAWLENIRRAKSELSPKAYSRLKRGFSSDHKSANFFFPVRNSGRSIKEGAYFLPYSLDASRRPDPPDLSKPDQEAQTDPHEGASDFSQVIQYSSVDELSAERLRARHALFDRLINANYQALEFMSSQAESLTRASAKLLLSQTRRMADLYHRFRGRSPDLAKFSHTQTAYERIRGKLKRRWQGLAPDEKLPEKPADIVLKLDPRRPLRSLNSLINWMHQKALRLFGSYGVSRTEASGSLLIYDGAYLPFIYLGQAPLGEVLRRNQILRAFQAEARTIEGLDYNDDFFFDEHRIWLSLHLGCHSAEISADSSPPDEGGMLRIRYKESGDDGQQYRIRLVAAFLGKLGFSVKLTGDDYLDAVLDKDHGLDSERTLAEIYPLVVRLLYSTHNLDIFLGRIAGKIDDKATRKFSSRLGELFFSEGRWPFAMDGERIYDSYADYLRLAPERKALAAKLNAELERLGLSRMPADIQLGQRTIDLFFTKPIQEALARGQLFWNGKGKPEHGYYISLSDLAFEAIVAPNDASQVAAILESLDVSLLTYEPIGKVGAFSAERGQKAFEDGSYLTVLTLRDPASGSLAYAKVLLWKPGKGLESLSPSKLLGFLRAEGLAAQEGEELSASQKKQLDSLLRAPLPNQSSSEQAEAYGLPAAPGKGDFVTGPILFDRSKQQEGAVLAVPYTSPDDMEALSKAAGVLTTGGGSLSHAAITTRELGIPSVILSSARWRKLDAQTLKPVLGLQLSHRKETGSKSGIGIAELSLDPDPFLREGDLVRVYGKEGKVALIARADDAPMQKAYAALEALRSGQGYKLEFDPSWDERVERFILEEAHANPRYLEVRFMILNSLSMSAKNIPATEISAPFSSFAGANKAPKPSFWGRGQGLFETSQAPRPLWRALARRLSKTQDSVKKSRLLGVLHRLLRKAGAAAKPSMHLIFVCTGNTCRSPMAEQITRQLLARAGIQNVTVASRGLGSGRSIPGEGLFPDAAQALRELGFTPEHHQIRGLSDEDVRSADVILTMSDYLVRFITEDHPEAAGKVMLLNRFAGLGDTEIEDPMLGPGRNYFKAHENDASSTNAPSYWDGPRTVRDNLYRSGDPYRDSFSGRRDPATGRYTFPLAPPPMPFHDYSHDFHDPLALSFQLSQTHPELFKGNKPHAGADLAKTGSNGDKSSAEIDHAPSQGAGYAHAPSRDDLMDDAYTAGLKAGREWRDQHEHGGVNDSATELNPKSWQDPVPSFKDMFHDAYRIAATDILTAVQRSMAQIESFLKLKQLDGEAYEEKLRKLGAAEPAFLDLQDIDDDMKPLVGGKSAKLGEMLQALAGQDADVPEGLALTIHAYKRFLKEAGLEDKVRALAMELDALLNAPLIEGADRSKEISRLSERIRQVLMSAKLDPEKGVGKDILQALQKHDFSNTSGRWSVRSSAIQEDSDDAAFAGAAESYLNLKPDDVLSKVVENWASFWLPRGILYRQRQGLRSVDLLPATLIQKMAPAEISGVIFTRNPVDSADEVVINAAYGLGEGVVSGQAAADVYVTRKWDAEETELPHVARKRWRVENRPEGFGTRLGPVPPELRSLRALSREQTSRLTRVAVALENRFGKALDIEFSLLADGTIVILQARPITTR